MATNAMEIRLDRLEGVYEQIDKRLSTLEVLLSWLNRDGIGARAARR